MEAVLDNKENITPFPADKNRTGPQVSVPKKPLAATARPRKPLADITHLFVSARLTRTSSLPDIELLVGSRALAPMNLRKRRAFDDADSVQPGRSSSKSLRMGFR